MDEEQIEALREWLDEGKAPADFKRVSGMSAETFEELLEATMKTPAPISTISTSTFVDDK